MSTSHAARILNTGRSRRWTALPSDRRHSDALPSRRRAAVSDTPQACPATTSALRHGLRIAGLAPRARPRAPLSIRLSLPAIYPLSAWTLAYVLCMFSPVFSADFPTLPLMLTRASCLGCPGCLRDHRYLRLVFVGLCPLDSFWFPLHYVTHLASPPLEHRCLASVYDAHRNIRTNLYSTSLGARSSPSPSPSGGTPAPPDLLRGLSRHTPPHLLTVRAWTSLACRERRRDVPELPPDNAGPALVGWRRPPLASRVFKNLPPFISSSPRRFKSVTGPRGPRYGRPDDPGVFPCKTVSATPIHCIDFLVTSRAVSRIPRRVSRGAGAHDPRLFRHSGPDIISRPTPRISTSAGPFCLARGSNPSHSCGGSSQTHRRCRRARRHQDRTMFVRTAASSLHRCTPSVGLRRGPVGPAGCLAAT